VTKGADMSPPFTCLSIALSPSSNGIRQTPPPTSMGAAARIVNADARAGAVPPQRPTRVCGEKRGGGPRRRGWEGALAPQHRPTLPPVDVRPAVPPRLLRLRPGLVPQQDRFPRPPRGPSRPQSRAGVRIPAATRPTARSPPRERGSAPPPHEGGSFTPANSSQAAPQRPSQPSLPFPIFFIDGQVHCLP